MEKTQAQIISPQEGFQTQFLASSADIVIGGGAAGAGKSYALLLEALRHCGIPDYGAVIFRRTNPQIKAKGGLWDASVRIYTEIQGAPKQLPGKLLWRFDNGAKIEFKHLQHESDRFNWQGSEIPFIGWDELTHFTKEQFFYLLSRNRSTCGIKPYVRATTNPQSFGWVKEFISWWLYPDDYKVQTLQGYPIPERAGVVRYFIQHEDNYVWGDTKEEVIKKVPSIFQNVDILKSLIASQIHPHSLVKSVTFVPGTVYQNKSLLSTDPGYLGNLMALSNEEKSKLLGGCWKLLEDEDQLFEYMALKDIFTNDFVPAPRSTRERYITADIALEGSDFFRIGVWNGWRLVKTYSFPTSDGKLVYDELKKIARQWDVPHSNIVFDADGVGGFLRGFFPTAISFNNNGTPIEVDGDKQNYQNLKTQCYYYAAQKVNGYEVYVEASEVGLKDGLIEELHATRKKPHDGVSKLRILSKDEIKVKIGGRSPDYADMFAMRSVFDLLRPVKHGRKPKVGSL